MNTSNAKKMGLAILVIGLALTLFPRRIEMHIYPEQRARDKSVKDRARSVKK